MERGGLVPVLRWLCEKSPWLLEQAFPILALIVSKAAILEQSLSCLSKSFIC